ncbi:putative cupredoxin [Rosa chinensis]|uniref:Putative cupredoxin n=1 Tax=Rosa chinensis TaxID=74649 RepID=A0A2P6QBV0_ROSCH|nr:early nodulin-like protein 1 [Rosa chinensis]PRQ31651.1 putative cupredoxin [Rosa chinensis]
MANSNILRVYNKSIAFPVLGLLCLSLLLQKSGANEFTIAWTVPDASTHFSQWAETNRFQIGDSLVFNYSPGQDSVLRVGQDDYTNCNTDAPTAEKYTDGHSTYKFNQSGPFYFMSGNKDNCLKNEKMVVIVLADRNQTSNATPSPAPSGEASPPPPSPGTVQINPTPAPESDHMPPPPPSGASSIFISLVGTIGAVAAYSSFLLF